nr:unnamed protein product [Callosobruchus analis]
MNAVSLQVSRRDTTLVQKQEQLACSITAFGTTISSLLTEEGGSDRRHLQLLSDAGRLLCDFYHSETQTRKGLITINLNKDLKETFKDSPSDDFCFGVSLEERLKNVKELERSNKELRPNTPAKVVRGTTSTLNSTGRIRQSKGIRAGPQHSNKVPFRYPQNPQQKRGIPQVHRIRRSQEYRRSRG